MPALRGTKARDDGGARRGYHSPNVKPMPPSFPSRRNATHLATGGTGRIACASEKRKRKERRRVASQAYVTESQKRRPEASGTTGEKIKRAGRSDFRTPVESIGLPKPEMPALRETKKKSKTPAGGQRYGRQKPTMRTAFVVATNSS